MPPLGWEVRFDRAAGQVVYLNHQTEVEVLKNFVSIGSKTLLEAQKQAAWDRWSDWDWDDNLEEDTCQEVQHAPPQRGADWEEGAWQQPPHAEDVSGFSEDILAQDTDFFDGAEENTLKPFAEHAPRCAYRQTDRGSAYAPQRSTDENILAIASRLPPNWEVRLDSASGRIYFLNVEDETTSWEEPQPLNDDAHAEGQTVAFLMNEVRALKEQVSSLQTKQWKAPGPPPYDFAIRTFPPPASATTLKAAAKRPTLADLVKLKSGGSHQEWNRCISISVLFLQHLDIQYRYLSFYGTC